MARTFYGWIIRSFKDIPEITEAGGKLHYREVVSETDGRND